MKLYVHPASTTSRPAVLFAAERKGASMQCVQP
jgi:hypothetical protein